MMALVQGVLFERPHTQAAQYAASAPEPASQLTAASSEYERRDVELGKLRL
jgi:hypothetical protein